MNKKIQTTSTKCQYQAAASNPKCWFFLKENFPKESWKESISLTQFLFPVKALVPKNWVMRAHKTEFVRDKNQRLGAEELKRSEVRPARIKQNNKKIVPIVTCKPWNPVVTKKVVP